MSAFAPDDGDTLDTFVEEPSTSPPLPQSSSLHSIHDPDASHHRSNNPLLGSDNLVSDLEQEVLDEYTRLLGNVNQLSDKLGILAGSPSSLTLDGLRLLERKTATVCTLLKASVYSIVLQQQIWNENVEQQQQQQQRGGGEQDHTEFQDQEYRHDGDEDVTFQ
ncbi:hypothetical protein N7474_000657 [Penicillium riverlandense]|uniref:uncharacterized protein n=1 Tax=Penicillium riverlandense TaxID=1903569 RepID=UPI002546DF3F|nr:uncharacterized protein N7474_000657 [Penicillium riverlandense]KAJ5832346.1 hypothetical protein N7474_000657 [Penicillium riverlandense]